MKRWILGGVLGSSPEGSFLTRESPIWAGLIREGQKRESGSIESEGDLRGWIWVVSARIGDFREYRVSPKFTVSHFHLMSPFCVNYVELEYMLV